MALINVNHTSFALGYGTSFVAIVPESQKEDITTLYLLHGLSDDQTCWQRYTIIERYANERGIAVIMPFAERSFYTDMVYGPSFLRHVAEETVDCSRRLFKLSDKREKTFVAGLSMGGYGALKIAFTYPEVFGGAVSLSGVTDIVKCANDHVWDREFTLIFGDDFQKTLPGSKDDLFALCDKLASSDKPKPVVYQVCGDEDFLLEHNRNFSSHIKAKNFEYTYKEYPGNHNWDFWNKYLPEGLDFIMNK